MTTKRFQTGTKRFLGPPKGFLGHQRFQALADRFRNTGEQVTKGAKHRTTRFLLCLNVLKPGDVECETRTPLPKPVVCFLFFCVCKAVVFILFGFLFWSKHAPSSTWAQDNKRAPDQNHGHTADGREWKPKHKDGNENTKSWRQDLWGQPRLNPSRRMGQ